MAGRSAYDCVGDNCEPRIPLFPLRYSVQPRKVGDKSVSTYGAANLPLETGFPTLHNAQYDLRCIGGGFIYLLDETHGDVFVWKVGEGECQFIELLAKTRTLNQALNDYKQGSKVPYLWGRRGSRVHLLLTDTLLTDAKLRDLQRNKDGIRDKLATTLDLSTWKDASPARNSFPASRIGQLVEEYKGTSLDFSIWKIKPHFPTAEGLHRSMKAQAPEAQIAVVMHDHVALVQDLGGIFQIARQQFESYLATPDKNSSADATQRFHKKLIADLIDRIYTGAYADRRGISPDDPAALDRSVQGEIKRREVIRKQYQDALEPLHRDPASVRIDYYRNAKQHFDSMPSEPVSQRAAVLADGASRYSQHVREADRVAFLKQYAANVKKLHGDVLDTKNDRCVWLQRYPQAKAATDFGSSFLRYDLANEMSSSTHAVAFAHCIESMIWGTQETPPGKKDNERDLFAQWWAMPYASNPILVNIANDKGFGSAIWENKMDAGTDSVWKLIGIPGKKFVMHYIGTHYLMGQVSIFILTRPANWKGAVRNNVDAKIHALAGTGSEEDAAQLRKLLEERYKDQVTSREITPSEFEDLFKKAAGAQANTIIAEGSIAQHMGNSIEILEWKKITPLTRYANPFMQTFEGGAAGGVLFLSCWNLIRAIRSFEWKKGGTFAENGNNVSNMLLAIFGVGGGLNGALAFTQARLPAIFERVSLSGSFLRGMAGVGALRFFGYGGAIFDAITQWTKAWGEFQKGNKDAGTCYAVAGLALGMGGYALTAAGAGLAAEGATLGTALAVAGTSATVPIAGWIVAGIILVGVGLWFVTKGDHAQYTDLDFWLNDGTFGKHELLGRPKTVTYANLNEENDAYVKITQPSSQASEPLPRAASIVNSPDRRSAVAF
ncbi:toxin VasX [Paraburkholderia tropica]|uniref:toxin VasX n=1 Tax=Paraburkholderia tropica TaxID=92647 RepID=UPI002AB21DF8|nr:toxin VasX [Paraburkholderia tropica]